MIYEGIVQKDLGEGKRLGFPTANISFNDSALSGIYAARVQVRGKTYIAAVYADQARRLLESHILDFEEDLYGERITVQIEKKIRETQRFTNKATLKAAIAKDVQDVREYFASVN